MRTVDAGVISALLALIVAVVGGTKYILDIRSDLDRLKLGWSVQVGEAIPFTTGGGGRNTEPMLPSEEGVCFLTRVEGALAEGAYVRITHVNNVWTLETQSRTAGTVVRGAAHCLRFAEP